MKHSILVVDDESDNVDALERLFRRRYNVLKATSGRQGLELIQKESVALIISDQRMPQMTGIQFLQKSMDVCPDAIRILLTGYTDIESVVDAINAGQVYRYLTKPWDPVDLTNTIDKAIEKYELRFALKEKNAQLQKALEELQTLDQAKNHFMVLVNHELKTPLTVLISFLDLLKETSLSSEQSTYVQRIQKSTGRLQAIIDDVLELVSAETGLKKTNKKKIKLPLLVPPLTGPLLEQAQNKGQNIVTQIEDIKVNADKELIHSVIQRILENAIKFGEPNSEIQIESRPVETVNEEKAQSKSETIRLVIANKGKALAPKVIEKIMKPFALDEDILHHSAGLGLGLSLCQALLKCHQSQLQVECPKGMVEVAFTLDLS